MRFRWGSDAAAEGKDMDDQRNGQMEEQINQVKEQIKMDDQSKTDGQIKLYNQIRDEAAACGETLLGLAALEPGEILVVGCSTSEIMGRRIGSASNEDAAAAVFDGIYPLLRAKGIWLAAQCCEHLNRALVMEKAAALAFGLERVSVVPAPKAGGSWAAWVYRQLEKPVVVENLDGHKAAAGIDIGETWVGMHLRPVAVMARPERPWVGEARVTLARTRPKLIGGSRARYE